MTWRVARSLETLLAEIDTAAPKRSKVSDGSIGDTAHASRTSDHNPYIKIGSVGIVRARDFTHDPGDGFDAHKFADWLRGRCKARKEKRVRYIISNGRIASPIADWAWRPYTGVNAHTQHTHVSVSESRDLFDDDSPWGWLAEREPDVTGEDHKKIRDAIRNAVDDAFKPIGVRLARLEDKVATLDERIPPELVAALQPEGGLALGTEVDGLRRGMRSMLRKLGLTDAEIAKLEV